MNQHTTALVFDRRLAKRIGVFVAVVALVFLVWPKPSTLPAPIRAGTVLAGVLFPGQPPLTVPGGLVVRAVDGPWARVHFGPEDRQGRWIHFQHVAAFTLPPQDD